MAIPALHEKRNHEAHRSGFRQKFRAFLPHLATLTAFIIYCILGAYAIQAVEIGNENSTDWSYKSALLFTFTVSTTIGYGHTFPTTDGGKILCIFLGLIGIPIGILTCANLGQFLSEALYKLECWVFEKLRTKEGKKLLSDVSVQAIDERASLLTLTLVTVLTMIACAVCVSYTESLSIIDSVYFTFISISTIGFGDISIGYDRTWPLLLVLLLFTLGLTVMTMLIELLTVYLRKLHYLGRHLTNVRYMSIWVGSKKVPIGSFTKHVLQKAGVDEADIEKFLDNMDDHWEDYEQSEPKSRKSTAVAQDLEKGSPPTTPVEVDSIPKVYFGKQISGVPFIDDEHKRLMSINPGTLDRDTLDMLNNLETYDNVSSPYEKFLYK